MASRPSRQTVDKLKSSKDRLAETDHKHFAPCGSTFRARYAYIVETKRVKKLVSILAKRRTKVAFTGSFYPPHEGHRHVVEQAKLLGLEVIVFVANNVDKHYALTMPERVAQAEQYFNTQVIGVEAANIGSAIKEAGCAAIVRGIRDQRDFVYEEAITKFNLTRNGLPTIYIPSPESLKGVSSSAIRAEQYALKN